MALGTSFQDIYDAFFSKIDEDLSSKEGLVFTYLKTALSKVKKTVNHSLEYDYDKLTYDGDFVETLDDDEIELISLCMLYEHKRKRKEYYEQLKKEIGTKDFNNLDTKYRELQALESSMKDLRVEIEDCKQQFNTYKYN